MNGFHHTPPPYVARANETEDDLIRQAQESLTSCNWTIGRLASEWTERFARGRTDGAFGDRIGLSEDQVRQRRNVWEKFGATGIPDMYPELSWSHFYAALNWEDASDCLQWANDLGATVGEMKAWRRAKRGEDLSEPASGPTAESTAEPAAPSPAAADPTERDPQPRPSTIRHSPETRKRPPPEPPPRRSVSRPKLTETDTQPHPTAPPQGVVAPPASAPMPPETPRESPAESPDADTHDQFIARLRALLLEAKRRFEPGQLNEIGETLLSFLRQFAPGLVSAPKPAKPGTFAPPTLEEVAAYCEELRDAGKPCNVDPEHWIDFYASKNWIVGKTKMKDWRAALRNAARQGWADPTRIAANAPRGSVAAANARSDERRQQLDDWAADGGAEPFDGEVPF